jgi:hypothetical protein
MGLGSLAEAICRCPRDSKHFRASWFYVMMAVYGALWHALGTTKM